MLDFKKMNEEINASLEEEKYEKIKEDIKKVVEKNYYRMKLWRQLFQNVKCVFGRHLYNWVPSMDITTCPCCTRIWNGRKGEPHA